MGAGGAAQSLGVSKHFIPIAIHAGILALGQHVGTAHRDGAQFVCADAAIKNLLFAGLGIEKPAPIHLHDRNRERPGVGSYGTES